jgi:hypothetical protein
MSGFNKSVPGHPVIDKDPTADLDYTFNFAQWLGNDTITSFVISSESGVTTSNATNTPTTVIVWVSGGTGLPRNTQRRVSCKITTNNGRTDTRSIWLNITSR